MHSRHISNASRRERQQRQRRQRLCPFDLDTPLAELINPKYHGLMAETVEKLRPWLPDEIPKDTRRMTRFDFDWSQEDCTPMNVCRELALFFCRAGGGVAGTLGSRREGKTIVKWKPAEFFRYLTSSEHGNFGLSEMTLKVLISKAFQELI